MDLSLAMTLEGMQKYVSGNNKMAEDKDQSTIRSNKSPEEFVMKSGLLLAVHTQTDDLNIRVDSLKKISDGHTKLLSDILTREGDILKQLLDLRDEGGKMTVTDIAPNNQFFIIDTNRDPGHKVKSVVVTNNGPNDIFVGEDAAFSPQVDADLVDIVSDQSRFIRILPTESERFSYNVRSIKSIHILSDPSVPGSSQFRARLAW